ncbi:methyltransferase domain-containing protein [Paenibacillus sp. OV219]|uniref:methyltransferase domain-containing protein n=1 Tax=Paenibacillus sp. OV219 TaxID=1884377 RepID=UPI0008B390E4|nr:methyltransferase domain-containing protein [Paenibacillus sp. OV219]SEM90140.1 Methyltransferase domain-containing protein [Paenibacillus sp. OV219]
MKLDIGCGSNKQPGYYGIDRTALPGVNLVSDLNSEIPFPDNSVELILVSRMLAYANDLNYAMGELYRVSTHGAIICLLCPYAHNFRYSSNPYLKSRFDEHTPRYLTTVFRDPPGSPPCPQLVPYQYFPPPPYDFRLLRMELFYNQTYQTSLYEPEELELLKELQANVVDEIMYHYVVVKAPMMENEWLTLCEQSLPEPYAATLLRSIPPF